MKNIQLVKNQITESVNVKNKILEDEELMQKISLAADKITDAYKNNNKTMLAGNGGSAADSQHIAAELVGRYLKERPGLPAISLTTDTSALTAIGNDYGYDFIFSRQLESLANKGDVVIGITTSGNSKNIINVFKKAKSMNCKTIALTGRDGGSVKDFADISVIVPDVNTPHIQECHILIGHLWCSIVDDYYKFFCAYHSVYNFRF